MALSRQPEAEGEGPAREASSASGGTRKGQRTRGNPRTKPEPQFKNAIKAVARDLAILATGNVQRAFKVIEEILMDIRQVKYYRPIRRRPAQPRVTKRNKNKWIENRGLESRGPEMKAA